jgi:hypothetical protein
MTDQIEFLVSHRTRDPAVPGASPRVSGSAFREPQAIVHIAGCLGTDLIVAGLEQEALCTGVGRKALPMRRRAAVRGCDPARKVVCSGRCA